MGHEDSIERDFVYSVLLYARSQNHRLNEEDRTEILKIAEEYLGSDEEDVRAGACAVIAHFVESPSLSRLVDSGLYSRYLVASAVCEGKAVFPTPVETI